jgi:hypothetical protein
MKLRSILHLIRSGLKNLTPKNKNYTSRKSATPTLSDPSVSIFPNPKADEPLPSPKAQADIRAKSF